MFQYIACGIKLKIQLNANTIESKSYRNTCTYIFI